MKSLDEYCTLTLNLSGIADSLCLRVQLLNNSGGIVKEAVAQNSVVHFDYVNPGKYYVGAFVDANRNGVWDTGNYDEDLQAEAVYYYSRMIGLDIGAKVPSEAAGNRQAEARRSEKAAEPQCSARQRFGYYL